jgi:hypothetical protein
MILIFFQERGSKQILTAAPISPYYFGFSSFYFIMAQFCSVHIHAKNNEKDLFITVHHGFHHFHYLVNVLNRFSSYFIMIFIYIYIVVHYFVIVFY